LHFWEVVPLEVLLEEMAEARSSHASAAGGVAQKLHQLLVPSYFPGPEEGVVSCHAFLPLQAAFLFCIMDRHMFTFVTSSAFRSALLSGTNASKQPLKHYCQHVAALAETADV
jgi:hypothetical protein